MGVDFGRLFKQRLGADTPHAKTCKFIICERPYGPDPWCGKSAKSGSSYCDHHHSICYEPFNADAARNFNKGAAYVGRISR